MTPQGTVTTLFKQLFGDTFSVLFRASFLILLQNGQIENFLDFQLLVPVLKSLLQFIFLLFYFVLSKTLADRKFQVDMLTDLVSGEISLLGPQRAAFSCDLFSMLLKRRRKTETCFFLFL